MKLLKQLTQLNAISGNESAVRLFLEKEFSALVSKENISYDNLGSIIAKKGHNGPKIALSAHMDEIGLMVTKITDDGYIRFQTIGGWWGQVMLAQQMQIITKDQKKVLAVVGSKPPHILSPEELKSPVKIEDMYLDLGLSSKAEVEAQGIRIGDMITPYIDFEVLANGDFLLAKAWDDRIGCGMLVEVLKELQDIKHPNTVYVIGSTQEEVGLRGAKTSSNLVAPDISIALDVGIAKDTPGTDGSVKLGGGPQILIYDGGLIGHLGLREVFLDVAEKHNIPVQLDYLQRGATDAGAMHLAHSGSPAISFCIPSRYIHSHTSIISYKDYKACIKLLVEVIKVLDQKLVDKITFD